MWRFARFLGRERVLSVFAPPLIFLGALVNFILYHGYEALAPEALLAYAVTGGAGLALGLLLAVVPSDRLRASGFAALLFIFLELQYQIVDRLHRFGLSQDAPILRYLLIFAILSAAAFLILSVRKHVATIFAVVFAVILASTIAMPPQPISFGKSSSSLDARDGDKLPPVVHIILDGHIGIEGIPSELRGGSELQRLLKTFYLERGFRLFGRAYSSHFLTRHSISAVLNPGGPDSQGPLMHQGEDRWALAENRYFRKLAGSGYGIRVYQTEYLRYCGVQEIEFESCMTYSGSSLRLIEGLGLSAAAKARLMLGGYLSRSRIYFSAWRAYDAIRLFLIEAGLDVLPRGNRRSTDFHSLGVLPVVQRVKGDILSLPNGRIFFVHLMLPHAPFFLTSDCRVRDISDWYSRKLYHKYLATAGSRDFREQAYRRYFEQIRCLYSVLGELFDSMRQAGMFQESTIVVHGDHGSRINLFDPVSEHARRLTSRDLKDSYSTLYAIRSARIEPGYDTRSETIQNLFSEHMFGRAPNATREIYLAPTEGHPIRPFKGVPFED